MTDQDETEQVNEEATKPKKSYSVSKILLIGTAVGVVASAGCCAVSYPKLKKKYDNAKNHVKSNPGPMF